MSVDAALEKWISALRQARRVWLALSGGIDSQILFHALLKLQKKQGIDFSAIHINHGISSSSNQWAQACFDHCKQHQIPCAVISIDASSPGKDSLEAFARKQRYLAIRDLAQVGDVVLLAQHQDDQMETVFLQLIRGAGVQGLAAMAECSPFADAQLIRPLLQCDRQCIEQYAALHSLTWIEDPSNSDLRFDRNYLRTQISPKLKERWPAVNRTITRAAQNCAETQALLECYLEQDYQAIKGQADKTISLSELQKKSPIQRRALLRYWINLLGFLLPGQKQLSALESMVIQNRQDSKLTFCWAQFEVRRFGDDLYVMEKLPEHNPRQIIVWDVRKDFQVELLGKVIHFHQVLGQGVNKSLLYSGKVEIRFRQGGEKIKPHGHKHTRSLKKLLQQWHVPPWQRDRIPLIYVNDQLAVIVGHCVAASFVDHDPGQGASFISPGI